MNINSNTIKEIKDLTGTNLTLGSYIGAIRQGEGWSQSEIAKMLGVSRQFICDLEHNRRNISLKIAEEMALKLGYSSRQFVRLCLQDMLNRQGLRYQIELQEAA